ncbi:hypothetical protein A6E05_13580 [Aliivibrio sp. 1S165]|uniref:hypothetical protein n=1 Tax=unclassified Aliivibrio TaxID=2645654 RepID=UPI00080E4736|nr:MULTISPECIES: hypothetical protein [unclassified Aliivibrio]OCH17769.1 hypothetical protein A6E05_13580 [Aliivibrio sp. 1S165]OCH33775.1 hypothetical protein A6E06_17805 [Aliivibrio sp. 1S175]
MLFKRIVTSVVCFLLLGCSGKVIIQEPKTITNVPNSMEFSASYSDIWLQVIDWFAANNIKLDHISRESGFISASTSNFYKDAFDCGDVQTDVLATLEKYSELSSLNVTVRTVGDNTKITINLTAEFYGSAHDNGWGNTLGFSGQCVSTGKLESSLWNFVKES